MKVKLECPKCGYKWEYGYWKWIWKAPFHWLALDAAAGCVRDYRRTKCPVCNQITWIARKK